MNWNYPPGTFKLPDDDLIEREYIFEIYGEVKVMGYSEEGAEETFYDNLKELILEAKDNETIEIK